jgi:hypothetical protein
MPRVELTRGVRIALFLLRIYLAAMFILLGLKAVQLFR